MIDYPEINFLMLCCIFSCNETDDILSDIMADLEDFSSQIDNMF